MGNHLIANFVRDVPINLSRYIKRKTRRFNVVPRAEKQLEKINQINIRAPNYEATMKEVERLMKEMPQSFDKLKEKDEQLHKNLENVFVTSDGENVDKFAKQTITPSLVKQFNEVKSYEEVPTGKYNLTRVEHFLSAHAKDPKIFNADVLSEVYKIDPKTMKNILKRVKLFDVAVPGKQPEKTFIQRFAKETMPKDLVEEGELVYLERKMIEARDLFDEYYKNEPRDTKKELLHITDWTMIDALQGKLPTLAKEYVDKKWKSNVPKKENDTVFSDKVRDRSFDPLLDQVQNSDEIPEKIVRPSDFDFDVFESINKKKIEATSNMESEPKEKASKE